MSHVLGWILVGMANTYSIPFVEGGLVYADLDSCVRVQQAARHPNAFRCVQVKVYR